MEFEIVPPASPVQLILGGVAALMLVLATLFGWLAVSTSRLSIVVDGGSLHVNAPLYGRVLPLSDLDLTASQVIRIDRDSPMRPTRRTNGIGAPGYGVGWFRMENGGRALAVLTSRDNVAYVPTRNGYVLLLSVKDAEGFLRHLQSRTINP